MVYAEPKIGKSHFAASACLTGRWVVVSSGNGLSTYKGAEVKKAFPDFNPDNVQIELITPDKSLRGIKAFQQLNDLMNDLFDRRISEFDGIIIDDASFVSKIAQNQAILVNGMESRSATLDKANSTNAINKPFQAIPVLDMTDFGREMEAVYNFLARLTEYCRTYGKHCIVCAHEQQVYIKKRNERDKEIPTLDKITASFTGKKEPTKNSTHFDIVSRLTRKGKEASMKVVFQCKSDGLVDAGDRYGVLNMYEDNLTWQKVLDKVAKMETAQEPERKKPTRN